MKRVNEVSKQTQLQRSNQSRSMVVVRTIKPGRGKNLLAQKHSDQL